MKYPIIVEEMRKHFSIISKKVYIRDLIKDNLEKVIVLDDISFNIKPGEIVGVMGKNGAGKSTLLRVLGGVYRSDRGKVIINGKKTAIFELGNFLNVYQTGREYCYEYFYLTKKGMKNKDFDQVVEDIYNFTGLNKYFDKPIHTYSSGMRAKLLFAVATALPTDVILIDEALVVGDEYFQGKAWKRLCNMLSEGASGVIVSHDWVSLLKLCERTIILEKGKMVFDGNTRTAINFYLGREIVVSDEIFIKDKERLQSEGTVWDKTEDFSYHFEIEVKHIPEGEKLCLGLTVERFITGTGLEPVCTCVSTFTLKGTGIYRANMVIQDLNIEAGDYWIGLIVMIPPERGSMVSPKVYDIMSWVDGNAIRLKIPGENKDHILMKRKLEWKVKII